MIRILEIESSVFACRHKKPESNERCGGTKFSVKISNDQSVFVITCCECHGDTVLVSS